MPTRILLSDKGRQPSEIFGFMGAFSKPRIGFSCDEPAWGKPAATAPKPTVWINERRETFVFWMIGFMVIRVRRTWRRRLFPHLRDPPRSLAEMLLDWWNLPAPSTELES